MFGPHAVGVVVDGFRGRQDDGPGPGASLPRDQTIVRNSWTGPGDSLRDRLGRLVEWNAARGDKSAPVHLVALSMGCQVAVRLGQELDLVDEVVLVAPDPKARLGDRDTAEAADGIVSAFREAQDLWDGAAVPSQPFAEALVALAARTRRVRVIYCRTDGVAEWDRNVDALVAELATIDGVRLIEAVDGETVSAFGVTVDLSAGETTDVHQRLWSATHL